MGKNKAEFKEKFKAAQEEDRVMNMVEERKLSSNARELKKHFEKKEEQQIKMALDKIRKKQNKDNWKSPNMILSQKSTILKNDRPILMEKNIFLDNKTKIPIQGGDLFFKW